MGCEGANPNCESDEFPVHSVTLSNDYLMGVTEITQAEYEAVMGTNPSYWSSCGSGCPVEYVTWHMAAAFANAVTASEGLSACYVCTGSGFETSCSESASPYTCTGFRLPTSAEWEAAGRCQASYRYSGSDDIGSVAWYEANSGYTPHAVAGLAPNDCGLYDMTGNVWEWVDDWYTPYSAASVTDPYATSGTERELRGGAFERADYDSHISYRGGDPGGYAFNYGIRLVQTW
jgi:formylglycine-generating enzyme required for sulfatase activity